MPRPSSPGSSSALVLQTIAWMRRHGFQPVVVHHASKAAVSRDYVSLSYVPPDDDVWRNRPYNVGVVTGPATRGPVDVDLDCPEALFFAPYFLPQTPAVFGRASKPKSHYLYRVEGAAFDKVAYGDPTLKNATIVEIRADGGHQTVMPGSVHEDSGEVIGWSDVPFPEVPTVTQEVLSRAVRKIAIATLIARHMWNDGFHHRPTLCLSGAMFYLDWTVDEAESVIRAVMGYSGDDDKSRIPSVRTTFKRGEAGKKIAGAGVLRKEVSNDAVVDRFLEWAGSPTISMLQQYNDRYAVVALAGKFRIADLDVPPGEPPTFYQGDDFVSLFGTDQVEIEGKSVPKVRLWLANPRRRQYRRTDFMPGQESDGDVLNLWTGWSVLPSPVGSCEAWLELLRDVVCSTPEEARWLEHWFAGIFRDPMSKPGTAPVIISAVQGVGKTLLLTYVGRILGRGYLSVTNDKHVHGNFNRHLATALLVHSEEALHGGDKHHRGIIKSLITDETIPIEAKGIDVQIVRSFHRLVLTSNENLAAPVEMGDRRYTIIDMRRAKVIDEGLRERVLAEMRGGGPAALHHYFTTMEYDPHLARTNLKSESLGEMKSLNLEPVDAWWYGVLQSGTLLPDYLTWSSRPDDDHWPQIVSTPALYCSMVLSLRDRGSRFIQSEISFYLQLSRLIGVAFTKGVRNFTNPMLDGIPQMARSLSDRQQAILDFPSLGQCRAAFVARIGQEVTWPGDLPEEERGAHERY